jgi:hypothetical protein
MTCHLNSPCEAWPVPDLHRSTVRQAASRRNRPPVAYHSLLFGLMNRRSKVQEASQSASNRRPISPLGSETVDNASLLAQLPLGRQSPNSAGSLAARLSAADWVGNQGSSTFLAQNNAPSQASRRSQMWKRSESRVRTIRILNGRI